MSVLLAGLQLWHLLAGDVLLVGSLIIWATKLAGRIENLEKENTDLKGKIVILDTRQDNVKSDIEAIRISLARIETKLESFGGRH